MMTLLHVLAGFWLVSGMIGRSVAFAQAAQSSDAQIACTLVKLSDLFERRMVVPGSAAVLLLGLLAAWLNGAPLFGFLQGADANWLLASLVLYLSPAPIIPLYLVPRRRLRARAAEVSLAHGRITPELAAALADKVVIAYRRFELAIVVAITALMVTKPF